MGNTCNGCDECTCGHLGYEAIREKMIDLGLYPPEEISRITAERLVFPQAELTMLGFSADQI